jgi:hypothetical protein
MPIISITFYMVLIRIEINKKRSRSSLSTVCERTTRATERENSRHYPVKRLEVRVSQYTQNNSVYGIEDRDQPESIYKVEYAEEASCGV